MSSPHWKNRCTSEDTPLSGKVNSGKLRKLKKLGKLGKLNSYATAQYQKHSKNRLVVTSVFQFSSFPDSALAQLPEAVGRPSSGRRPSSGAGRYVKPSGSMKVGQLVPLLKSLLVGAGTLHSPPKPPLSPESRNATSIATWPAPKPWAMTWSASPAPASPPRAWRAQK